MYDFVWGELCDWYLELAKPALRGDEGSPRRLVTQKLLYSVFEDVLKLLHPFIPFVTEELWSAFGYGDGIIGRAEWPVPHPRHDGESVKSDMEYIQGVIRAMRNLRAEVKLPPQQTAPMMSLRPKDDDKSSLIRENSDLITLAAKVARVDTARFGSPKPPRSISTVTGEWELFFPVGDLLDVEREITRIRDELTKSAKELDRIKGKLASRNFVERAPEEIVEKERASLEEIVSRMKRLEENADSLCAD
jgi:valyl-tRNA synthetase